MNSVLVNFTTTTLASIPTTPEPEGQISEYLFRHSIVDNIGLVLGLISTIALIAVIAKLQKKEMVAYKTMMILFSGGDLLLLAGCVFFQPMIIVTAHGHIVIIENGPLRSMVGLDWFKKCLSWFWMFSITMSQSSVAVQFLFRYMVVVRSFHLETRLIPLFFILPFMLATVSTVLYALSFHQNPSMAVQLLNTQYHQGLKTGDFGYVAVSSPENLITKAWAIVIFVTFAAVYLTLPTCMSRILRYLRKLHLAKKTRAMERQINGILHIQASGLASLSIAPFVTYGICTWNHSGLFLRTSMALSCLFVWLPTTNSVLMILTVSSFRRQFIRMVECKANRVVSMSTVKPNVSTTNNGAGTQ